MKRILWAIPLLFLTGCLASNALQYSAMADNNAYRLHRVSLGMSEREVLCIMHKPCCYKVFEMGDDIYDVWFYVTMPTILDQTRMVPQNLTALTFKNGQLISIGYSYYNYLLSQEANKNKPPKPQPKKSLEDEGLERALSPSAPPQPAPATPEEKPTEVENKGLEKALSPTPQPPSDELSMSKTAQSPPPDEDEKPKKAEPWDEEGDRMKEDEEEQDFNFW